MPIENAPLVAPGDWAASGPFLLLMEDWFPEGVFDNHPHRGIETVTYVLEGTIEHYDNHGNNGTTRAGDVQWLTAGRGLIHNEKPAAGQTVHRLQLWVNLPRAYKLVPARHQDLQAHAVPVRHESGAMRRGRRARTLSWRRFLWIGSVRGVVQQTRRAPSRQRQKPYLKFNCTVRTGAIVVRRTRKVDRLR